MAYKLKSLDLVGQVVQVRRKIGRGKNPNKIVLYNARFQKKESIEPIKKDKKVKLYEDRKVSEKLQTKDDAAKLIKSNPEEMYLLLHEFHTSMEQQGRSFKNEIGFNKADSRKASLVVDQIKQGYFKYNDELKESLRQTLYKYSQQIADIQNSKKLFGHENIIGKKFKNSKKSGISSAQLAITEGEKTKNQTRPTYKRVINGKVVNLVKFKPDRAPGAKSTESGIKSRIKRNSDYALETLLFMDNITKDPSKQQILSLFKLGSSNELGFKNSDKEIAAAFINELKNGNLSIERRVDLKKFMLSYAGQLSDILNIYKQFQKHSPISTSFISKGKKKLEDGMDIETIERNRIEAKASRHLKSVIRSLIFETEKERREENLKEGINKPVRNKSHSEEKSSKDINIGSSGGGNGASSTDKSKLNDRLSVVDDRLSKFDTDMIEETIPVTTSKEFGSLYKIKDENGKIYHFREFSSDMKTRDGYISLGKYEDRAQQAYQISKDLQMSHVIPSKIFDLSGKRGMLEADVRDIAKNEKNRITGMHQVFKNQNQLATKDPNIGDKAAVEYIIGGMNRSIFNTTIEHLEDGKVNALFSSNYLSFPGGGKSIDYPHGVYNNEEFFKSVSGANALISGEFSNNLSNFINSFKERINYLDGLSDSEAETLYSRANHVLNSIKMGTKKKGYATFRDIMK